VARNRSIADGGETKPLYLENSCSEYFHDHFLPHPSQPPHTIILPLMLLYQNVCTQIVNDLITEMTFVYTVTEFIWTQDSLPLFA
jgi:hypothetical protein